MMINLKKEKKLVFKYVISMTDIHIIFVFTLGCSTLY